MNDKIYDIINRTLNTKEDTVYLNEEELLNESVFFKVSPFVAFSAFKLKAFNSLLKNNALIKSKKGLEKANPLNAVAGIQTAKEKLKSKLGSKGKDKNDTHYRLLPEQRKVLAELYNKYGKGLIAEIQSFRDNVLAPYQVIKRNVKKNRILTSKEINGLSKDEFLAARESGRKKIEKRAEFSGDSKEKEEQLKNANEALRKAKELYDSFSSGRTKELSNDAVEKMLKSYGVGVDSLQGYSLGELKATYEAIIRNKNLIQRSMKYDDEEHTTDIMELLKKNRILKEKGIVALMPKKEGDETEEPKKGSFMVAFSNYMLRADIRNSFKDSMGGDIYKATYLSILKQNVKNLSERREETLSSFVKVKKNIEFNKNEEKVWGKIPTNVQKYSGNIKDYYQKITDEDYSDPTYIQKPKEVIKAEAEIEAEIKRFERKLAKVVEPEDLARLKKYRLINNLIIVSELRNPEDLFKTREEISSSSTSSESDTKESNKNYMDEEEYLRKLKHLVGLKYDTFQELSDAKVEVKALSNQVEAEISDKYKDIVKQFILKRTLESEKIAGHKYDNAGDILDINDIENFTNDILRREYTDIDQMKQDKIQLDGMIERYKKEEPNADKELAEIKMLMSQVDRKFQGMSIKIIGKENKKEEELDGKNEPAKDKGITNG